MQKYSGDKKKFYKKFDDPTFTVEEFVEDYTKFHDLSRYCRFDKDRAILNIDEKFRNVVRNYAGFSIKLHFYKYYSTLYPNDIIAKCFNSGILRDSDIGRQVVYHMNFEKVDIKINDILNKILVINPPDIIHLSDRLCYKDIPLDILNFLDNVGMEYSIFYIESYGRYINVIKCEKFL